MVERSTLPVPLQTALRHLELNRGCEIRVDAMVDNFAYEWIPDLKKAVADDAPGGWVRLPGSFPFGNPHGLVTTTPLMSRGGANVSDGHNPGHDMCKPVSSKGGANYYSWTWQDCPAIERCEDIVGVVQWYERRIRNG